MYIFVAGVEGSGHHFMANLLRWNVSLAVHAASSAHTSGSVPSSLKRSRSENARKLYSKLFSSASTGDVILEAAPSYPIGNPYRATRHPDLRSLMQHDGSLFDLRVLVAVRDPLDAILSTHHTRGWIGERADPAVETATTVECLIHLNAVLDTVPCGKIALMPLTYAANNPSDARKAIDLLLDLGGKRETLQYLPGGMDLDTNRNSYSSVAMSALPSSTIRKYIEQAGEQKARRKRTRSFGSRGGTEAQTSDNSLSSHVHGHSGFKLMHRHSLKLMNKYVRNHKPLFPLLDPT